MLECTVSPLPPPVCNFSSRGGAVASPKPPRTDLLSCRSALVSSKRGPDTRPGLHTASSPSDTCLPSTTIGSLSQSRGGSCAAPSRCCVSRPLASPPADASTWPGRSASHCGLRAAPHWQKRQTPPPGLSATRHNHGAGIACGTHSRSTRASRPCRGGCVSARCVHRESMSGHPKAWTSADSDRDYLK